MIKAEELRLGNLVYCKGKIDKLTRVEDNNYCTENCGHGVWNDDLEPIVLTEEILLRCGFELINNEFYRSRDHELNLFWTANKNKMIPEYAEKRLVTGCDFKHLHQLQNLYFALTGKELEINL